MYVCILEAIPLLYIFNYNYQKAKLLNICFLIFLCSLKTLETFNYIFIHNELFGVFPVNQSIIRVHEKIK